MGASTFQDMAFGKTCHEAFRSCVEDAKWNYGHGGYTGTIAEKGNYVEFKCPPRVKYQTMLNWAADWDAPTNENHQALKDQMQSIYNDKWGPAVAIKLGPAQEKEFRKNHGLERRKGGVWLFCGYASS